MPAAPALAAGGCTCTGAGCPQGGQAVQHAPHAARSCCLPDVPLVLKHHHLAVAAKLAGQTLSWLQARVLSIPEVLVLLQEAAAGSQWVLREFLAHQVALGSTDASLHTQLALQLIAWAAALLPPPRPRC